MQSKSLLPSQPLPQTELSSSTKVNSVGSPSDSSHASSSPESDSRMKPDLLEKTIATSMQQQKMLENQSHLNPSNIKERWISSFGGMADAKKKQPKKSKKEAKKNSKIGVLNSESDDAGIRMTIGRLNPVVDLPRIPPPSVDTLIHGLQGPMAAPNMSGNPIDLQRLMQQNGHRSHASQPQPPAANRTQSPVLTTTPWQHHQQPARQSTSASDVLSHLLPTMMAFPPKTSSLIGNGHQQQTAPLPHQQQQPHVQVQYQQKPQQQYYPQIPPPHAMQQQPAAQPQVHQAAQQPAHMPSTTTYLPGGATVTAYVSSKAKDERLGPQNAMPRMTSTVVPTPMSGRPASSHQPSVGSRPIPTSILVMSRFDPEWHPPLSTLGWMRPDPYWRAVASVDLEEGAMFIKVDGPAGIKKSFKLPFCNILATKNHQWPPSRERLGLEPNLDLARWELDVCVNPWADIRATIRDPWRKAYLMTVPVRFEAYQQQRERQMAQQKLIIGQQQRLLMGQ